MSNEENVYNNFEEYKKMLEMKNSPKINILNETPWRFEKPSSRSGV